jgi:hypothetical protein
VPLPLIPILGFVASNLARVALPAIARAIAPKVIGSAARPLASTIVRKVTRTAVIATAANSIINSNNKPSTPGPAAPTQPRLTPNQADNQAARAAAAAQAAAAANQQRSNATTSAGNNSNSGNPTTSGDLGGGSGQSAFPESFTSSDDTSTSSSSSATEKPPIKSAPIDAVIFADEAFSEEFLVDVLFEDLVGQELLTIARGDTVNGQEVIYQPIKNLGLLQGIYNPNNILGLADTSATFFSSFVIQLNEKIPTVGNPLTGKNYYVDPANGDIIIELINIVDDEQVEIQLATSGTIDRLGI